MPAQAQHSTPSPLPPVPLLRRASFGNQAFNPHLPRSRLNVPFPALEVAQPPAPVIAEPEIPLPASEPEKIAPPDVSAPPARKRRFGLSVGVDGADDDWSMGSDGGGSDEHVNARKSAGKPAVAQLDEMTGILERITLIGNWAIGSVLGPDSISKKVTGEALRDLVEGNE